MTPPPGFTIMPEEIPVPHAAGVDPVDPFPVWRGGRPQTPLPGGGSPPLALTFDMETCEDTVQFRRRTSVSGITGRPVANRPPPRKTVVILVWGAISESPTGSLRKFIVPGQGLPLGISPGTAPAPSGGGGGAPRAGRGGGYEEGSTSSVACGEGARPLPCPHPPGAMPTTVHCPGEGGILRVHQNRHGGSTGLEPRR
jgi:hypothetical protein